MFSIEQIEYAHAKINSGSEFPKYIQEIKGIGVVKFETWVFDSHTNYYGENSFKINSKSKYETLPIADSCNKEKFKMYLKFHQRGDTDYFTFCQHCAETGIEKWVVNLNNMTCVYYDKAGNQILEEIVPTI